jgi:hypothetical protein
MFIVQEADVESLNSQMEELEIAEQRRKQKIKKLEEEIAAIEVELKRVVQTENVEHLMEESVSFRIQNSGKHRINLRRGKILETDKKFQNVFASSGCGLMRLFAIGLQRNAK